MIIINDSYLITNINLRAVDNCWSFKLTINDYNNINILYMIDISII